MWMITTKSKRVSSKNLFYTIDFFFIRSFIRPITNSGSGTYTTLRKYQVSPNSLTNKQRVGTNIPPSSFRLPPPLSSSIMNSSVHNYETIPSSRARSLENIISTDRTLDIYDPHHQVCSNFIARIISNKSLL